MADIRYLVTLARRTDYPATLALAAVGLGEGVSVLSLDDSESGYWYDTWGGTNDVPGGFDAEIFLGFYLQRVTSVAALVDGTFFFSGRFVFIKSELPLWLYPEGSAEVDAVDLYASAARDSALETSYPDELGRAALAPVLLEVPSVPYALSEPVSGSTIAGQFRFTLVNSDGRFDDTDELNYTNTPSRLYRTDVDLPTLADFALIRYGLVDSVSVDGQSFVVTVNDPFRTLSGSVTRKFTTADYPSLPAATLDKDIPVGWGTLKNVPLFEVAAGQYVAIDPDYLTAVTTVYDGDGASIAFTVSGGIISATDAATADVTGRVTNLVSDIITSEVAAKAGIPFVEGSWDVAETNSYTATAARLNLYFASGSVERLVEAALKNDLAFLISKNDGRLTIRRWGVTYGSHTINSWQLMSLPRKSTEEGKRYYISDAEIKHQLNVDSGAFELTYYDGSVIDESLSRYRRARRGTFETSLYQTADLESFAARLLARFSVISELVNVEIGASTAAINLLDTVTLDLTINGRRMSNATTWVVRAINPAQDTLTLEAL